MTVVAGNRIGPYEIASTLGEGGMGEAFVPGITAYSATWPLN